MKLLPSPLLVRSLVAIAGSAVAGTLWTSQKGGGSRWRCLGDNSIVSDGVYTTVSECWSRVGEGVKRGRDVPNPASYIWRFDRGESHC